VYLPPFMQNLGYRTHAMVSLPVINPSTPLNCGFHSYKLMEKHNDFSQMLDQLDFSQDQPSFYMLNVGETHYPYAMPDEAEESWPRIHGVHGVFKHLDDMVVGGKLVEDAEHEFFDTAMLEKLKNRQIETVRLLDKLFEKLYDIVPPHTYITVTSDHGELFGEDGYFGHGPVMHEKVFEVPFLEGKIR
jgi:hypothetical protein